MVEHIKGMYQVKDPLLLRYYHQAETTLQRFNKTKVQHVPHANNSRVDTLVRLATTKVPPGYTVLYRVLSSPPITHRVTLFEHPQANSKAEAANKVILGELRHRLRRTKGLWAEQLPSIL
ncbi:hypothetical protein CR513_11972, partial [Mucuna pruriens]